ncbi:MAG: adenylosuccinate synthetase [Nanoarchaeota archaeon]|nr:adenylosuccinate synthetase [Nanoarchaeota archaeon]
MNVVPLVGDAQVAAVICMQFGDTGKGKFADLLARDWADGTARGTGGNNAGHTVVHGDTPFVFHLIPAGVRYDADGKFTVLGQGMVIDPSALVKEFDDLDRMGWSYDHVRVSQDAQVILPHHVLIDQAGKSQKDGGLGTTGRGIGPCYTDKAKRCGVRMRDLLDKDTLVSQVKKSLASWHPSLLSDSLHSSLSVDDVVGPVAQYVDRLRPFITDTNAFMQAQYRDGSKILLEGAQGTLLSLEHGTYPYVTSSECSLAGTAAGVGLSPRVVDVTLGILKFPLMTRVGNGPFPTELGGVASQQYCAAEHTRESELNMLGISFEKRDGYTRYDSDHPAIWDLMLSDDLLERARGLRLHMDEFGATTGRPRRLGWTDLVAARYAVQVNAPVKLVLTKVDTFADAGIFSLCDEYECYGHGVSFSRDKDDLFKVKPRYTNFYSYGSLRGCSSLSDLPASLVSAIRYTQDFVRADVAAVSVGPRPEETIMV